MTKFKVIDKITKRSSCCKLGRIEFNKPDFLSEMPSVELVNLIRIECKQIKRKDYIVEKFDAEAGNIPLFIENCWSGLFVGGG